MKIGKTVWHARRINDPNSEIPLYEKPVSYVTRPNYLTVMPASSRGLAFMQYGEEVDNTWTLTANGGAFYDVFSEGDLMWVDGASPIPEIESAYRNGASANAVVKSAVEVNLTVSAVLTRNKNRITQ